MADSARLFIAVRIEPTRPLRKMLSRLDLLGRAIRAVSADNLHLTLKFLGETDITLVPQIAAALKTAVAAQPPFSLGMKGIGVFPHARRPAVVWAGTEDEEPLTRIAAALEQLLKPLGFPAERRVFHPHLTLARIRSKPPAELAALLEDGRSTDFGAVEVASVQLYQSELHPQGSRYTVLARTELGAE